MKKLLYTFIYGVLFCSTAFAQESTDTVGSALTRINSALDVINRIKISGYIQGQFQVADMADSLGLLNGISSYAGGNFGKGVDKRIMLRRARVKVQYDAPFNEKGISTSQFVFQIDATERGLTIKDMYAKITDPWSGWFSLTGGNQNRPFGYEIGYSSSNRESPERGRMSQILFPNERDMGAMFTIQGPKWTKWNWLKLEAGFFNGTGAPSAGANASDFDKYKDFIGHLTVSRTTKSEKISWGLGLSMYSGGYRIDTVNVYKSGDSASVKGFALDIKKSDNLFSDFNNRKKAPREYIGFDAQVNIESGIGITTLRGEYIQGEHAGVTSSSNPAAATASPAAPVTSDIYIRNFNGAYFYFLQSIGQSRWQAIVKYDWYDPNTDVESDAIGKSIGGTYKTTGASDLKYTTLGFGLAYRWDANVKITAYYDSVENETTATIPAYRNDLKDNVFTLRMQIKF
jgi:hypothetical protein